MAKFINIKVEGLQAAVNKIKQKGAEVEKKLQENLDLFALGTVADASRLVPVDEGHLKNSIKPVIERLKVSVVVAADYAAFVEFGTKKYAAAYVSSLPQEWQEFASKFKGGGGSMDDFILRIMEWVKRKGFAAYQTAGGNASKSANSLQAQESAAYIIALRILQNGVKAHPFLFPAFEKNRIELIRKLKEDFK